MNNLGISNLDELEPMKLTEEEQLAVATRNAIFRSIYDLGQSILALNSTVVAGLPNPELLRVLGVMNERYVGLLKELGVKEAT